MRTIRTTALALMLGAAPAAIFAIPAQAQVSVDISVNVAPPPLPYYEQPPIPAEGYLWVPGYWAWDASVSDYYWVPGTWVEPPQRELLWTPAYWGFVDGHYGFHPGYWGREVGFYGGIDYGYGYGGNGYEGGRWTNGAFFYNRTVNNVENVHITNVYNQTVVVNNNRTNVSFNGGNGGTTARPTPQQETFAKERHVEATSVQREQRETASKDRSLFSKQNNGTPAVAATPRAGDFKGPGVSSGSKTPVAAKPGAPVPPNGAEKPGMAPNATGQKPGEPTRPGEPPRAGEMNKPGATPEERGKPMQQPSKAETPKAESPKAEPSRAEPPKGEPSKAEPKAEPRRPAEEHAAPPKAAPRAEPPREEPRRPAEPPKAEEPRRPEAAPHAAEPRPEARPPQPAAHPPQAARPPAPAAHPPGGRPGEEEKK